MVKKRKPIVRIEDPSPEIEDPSPEIEEEEISQKDPLKKTRKQIQVEDVVTELQEIRSLLTEEITTLQSLSSRVKGVRKLQTIRRKVESVEKKVPKLAKRKRTVRAGSNCGFGKLMTPSKELVEFLKIDKEEKISRTGATRAICAYIHIGDDEKREEILAWGDKMNPGRERNLQNVNDKNRIDPDVKLSKLLGYDTYKCSVARGEIMVKRKQPNGTRKEIILNDNCLYYTTIQRLLTKHLS